MFEIFSTRELALGIYLVLIVVWVFSNKKVRPAAINVIKAACSRQLAVPFVLMLVYASGLVYLLSFLGFWAWKYVKDVAVWFIFAGVPSCFHAASKKIEDHYFCHIFTENFKFTALAEFFLGIFTFSLPAEMLLQLILFFLFAMQAVAEKEEEYRQVKILLDWIITLLAVLLLYFTGKQAIASYSELGIVDMFVSFSIPILFSLVYVPVAYLLAVYAKYQILFVRMNFRSPQSKKIRFKRKIHIILICGLSYNRICRFERDYVNRFYIRMPESEFRSLLDDFLGKH